ncbi:hypothetical protein HMPREF0658_1846 [Hoylesella marshii DSM 16973 = JCM 13450]|uniref:Uncharacterized protein n=1 Tax=Hoylesella marshii DSM 16973 = JCM 13450 TaxID=862515 RepID=E0NUJ1_9BACT|nr:hypothetical protein HMPREF0658_1846 [Hoylesella marshii DSM 16973 = JCM 13450]
MLCRYWSYAFSTLELCFYDFAGELLMGCPHAVLRRRVKSRRMTALF